MCKKSIDIGAKKEMKRFILFFYICFSCLSLNALDDKSFQDILSMEIWPQDKLLNILTDENFKSIISDLQMALEKSLILLKRDLEINSPEKIASFFLSFNLIYFNVAWKTSFYTFGLDSLYKPRNYYLWDEASFLSENTSNLHHWLNVNYALKDFESCAFNEVIFEAYKAVKKAIGQLKYWTYPQSKELAQIFALAYINQPGFLKRHFLKVYLKALSFLEYDPEFKLTSQEVIENISFFTWERCPQNPMILSLKKIMLEIID